MANRTVNLNLPKRMIRRTKKFKNGTVWESYYYGVTVNGKRQEKPLGRDLVEATKKWAEFENKTIPTKSYTLGNLFDLYIENGMKGLKKRTIDDYHSYMRQLRKVFEDAPLEQVTTKDIADYRDIRSKTATTRANRELAMLSIVYNYAIDKGYCTFNPAEKVKKNKESKREYYATDEVFYCVLKHADSMIKDAMLVAYLTGQRPADIRQIRLNDITETHLFVGQNKTNKKLRIKLTNEDGRTTLGKLIDNILANKKDNSPFLLSVNGRVLAYEGFRRRFEKSKKIAIKHALDNNDQYLASQIKQFVFKDIRPKTASDMNNLNSASNLLGHTKEETTRLIYLKVGQEVNPLEVPIKNNDVEIG